MDILHDIVIQQQRRIRIRRFQMIKKMVLRDISNPFVIGDEVFFQHWRMYPHTAIHFINLIEEIMPNDHGSIPLHLQVLAVLRFIAEGSYQKGIAGELYHPMSQASFSRCLHRIIPRINDLAPRFITFPNTPIERNAIQRRFLEATGIPGILGAVDCTLPKIVAPHDHEEAYLNYKRQHSLTLQIVADMDYQILGTRICSGSTNDRFVWQWSDVRQKLYELRNDENIVQNEGFFYIIGDGGYSPSRVLLTPVQRAEPGTPAYRFSDALRRARVKVENVFGILKQRCRCLNKLRGLHYEPVFAAEIVQACTVLHNFWRFQGLPLPDIQNIEDVNNDLNHDDHEVAFEENNEYRLGMLERNRIIDQYFRN